MKDYIDWSIRVLDLHGESRLAVIKLQKAQTEANRVAERELQNKVEATKKANKKIVQSAREVISDETVILDKALDSSYSIVKKTSDNFKLAYTAAGKQMAATAKVITNSIKAAESRIKKLKSSTKALIGSLQDEIFNESLSRQGADQQVKSVVAEIKRLNIERKKAELAGATDLAVSLLKKESDLAIQLVKLDKDRVVERKKIDKELVKLAEDYKKDSAKKQTANERNKLRDQYKKESADLLAERAKVDDKSVGQYAKKYRSIYTELIKMAEEQQARLFKVELARIKKAGDAEKAALAELAIYKLQLKKIESFDIEKSLDGAKDKAAIDAIMVKRAEELNNLAIKTGALSKSEERTAALLAINEQKKVEQTAAELKIKILNQEIRKKALEDNRAAIADEEDAIVKRRAASAETLDAAIIRYRVIVADLAKQKKYLDVIKLESTKYDEAKRKLEFLERVKSRIMTDEIKKTGELNRLLKLQVGLLNSIKAAPASPAKGVVLPAKPRADGGQAYGSDSVSAMLSPGEYVVNAASSRKFYSQLVGMNGGNNNLRLADGGTTVGDINVNMSSSGNENYDASKLAQGLRRGIRRGTISL